MTTGEQHSTPRTRRIAVASLLAVTVIWGFTFLWMKQALDALELHLGAGSLLLAVGLFMALRFGISTVLLPLFLPGARRGLGDKGVWLAGLALAAILLTGFALQLFGLAGITPAVSAFLTSLYVVFTAILGRALGRGHVGFWMVVGALLATYGAATISGPPTLTFDLPEWLTVACGFVFAVHILATDSFTRQHRALPLSFATYAWVTLGSALMVAVGYARTPHAHTASVWAALGDANLIEPVLWSSVLGTVVALTLMNHFQRQLSPVRAAILYALEPVWTAILAITLHGARPDGWLVGGGLSLVLGNVLAEVGPRLAQRARAARLSATKLP